MTARDADEAEPTGYPTFRGQAEMERTTFPPAATLRPEGDHPDRCPVVVNLAKYALGWGRPGLLGPGGSVALCVDGGYFAR